MNKSNQAYTTNASSSLSQSFIKARSQIIAQNYAGAKKTLMQIITNRESNSYRVFYMLGIVCFEENDILSAKKYFDTVLDMRKEYPERHIESQLYLAVISVLLDRRPSSLSILLETKNNIKNSSKSTDSKNYSKYINNSLKYMKKYSEDIDTLLEIFNEPYRYKLLPVFGIKEKRKKIIRNIILLFLLLGVIGGGGWALYTFVNKNVIAAKEKRVEIISTLDQQILESEYKEKGWDEALEILSDREYKRLLKKIEKNFIAYNDNLVLVDANTILHSNRSQKEKNKIGLIVDNLAGVSYISDVTWFDFKKVIKEVWKYNDVTIKWKGTIAQISSVPSDDATNINGYKAQFLINFYGESKELYTTVTVSIPPHIILKNGDEVEILGIINVDNPSVNSKDFSIKIISFRYLFEGK